MPQHLVVLENPKDWLPDFPAIPVISAKDYLTQTQLLARTGLRVINLCRSYGYLSTGYFCSLLAEPRSHRVIPSVRTLTHLSNRSIYGLNVEDLDAVIQKSLRQRKAASDSTFELPIFFGRSDDAGLSDLARQIFDLFPCPLLKVEFRYQGKWHIQTVKPAPLNGWVVTHYREFFIEALSGYLRSRWRTRRARTVARYDLAILHNRTEKMPPSNGGALHKFIRAGRKQGLEVELIEKKDFVRLAEYDALFIRETTGIDHYTYRFARRAQLEGLVVIDDPDSILKCTNKVYLAELLASHGIPGPKTKILHKDAPAKFMGEIDFPLVLKIPDGSFSRGVFKTTNAKEFKEVTERLFKESDLILAQEFLYTDFDWRIGILNHHPLFACQYFMSRAHWQVVKHEASGRTVEGGFETWRVEDVPKPVIETALSLARLIGDGLYGVDLKQNERGIFVIEINDNPNIDAGIEDRILGDELYNRIIADFVRRLDATRLGLA